MFVKFMSFDQWQGRSVLGSHVANPTWIQVQQAITSLDGKSKTMVGISDAKESGRYMLIAGQWDGRCLVNATKDNFEFFSLIDSNRSSRKQILYVGGQNGDYEERKCVPMSWALEAAEYFCETGELKTTMNWQSDY